MPYQFYTLIPDVLKRLKCCKGNRDLLSLTTHPADGPVASEWVGRPFQSANDAPKMRQVRFTVMGSEEAQFLKSPKVLNQSEYL